MRTFSLLESVRYQVLRVQRQIKTLEASEFPYDHSQDALVEVRQIFDDHADVLDSLTPSDDKAVVEFHCVATFKNIRDLLPILGFILRSTNVRNAFEVWGPLWRLSCQVMKKETKLLLSSEWEYSPYTFVGYDQLPGFVLIGLPATESANPLLMPLAGHELGHSVWGDFNLKGTFSPAVQKHILDAIISKWKEYEKLFPGYSEQDIQVGSLGWQTWESAAAWAIRQAEECFCDFMGLRLFGEAFLHSTAYLLAPYRTGPRSYEYPNKVDRAKALVQAAGSYGFTVPDDFEGTFSDLSEPPHEWEEIRFLLSLADTARREICAELITQADEIVTAAGVGGRKAVKIEGCRKAFRSMVPFENSGGLVNILNAGWEALLADKFFPDEEQDKQREGFLEELVLKSIEILEVESRLAEAT